MLASVSFSLYEWSYSEADRTSTMMFCFLPAGVKQRRFEGSSMGIAKAEVVGGLANEVVLLGKGSDVASARSSSVD